MRIKLDENLPAELAQDLMARGHDVDSVLDEGLGGQVDTVVADAARRAMRILFTLDKGLGDVRRFPPLLYGGIVLFRMSPRGRATVRRLVMTSIPAIEKTRVVRGCLVVVSESSIRIRR